MTKKRFEMDDEGEYVIDNKTDNLYDACGGGDGLPFVIKEYHKLEKENEKLKKGMIEVVDRYIRNVEHNPPSSARTYLKVKGALVNVREGLRDLLEDLE